MTTIMTLVHNLPRSEIEPLRNYLFSVGPFTVYLYSFFIVIGILCALGLGLYEGKKIGIKSDDIIDGLIIILPLAVLGTRLWYVIFEWHRYSSDFWSIFRIWDGGLAIHGGFITAFVATIVYTKKRNIDLFRALDLMAPGFLIAQALGRWGNFFNQEAHGGVIGGLENGNVALNHDAQRDFLSNTLRLPDFITDNMFFSADYGWHYYHPTFLYESLWNILGLIIVLVLRRTKLIRSGDLIVFYLIWYSAARFFIEYLRTDALYIGGTGLRIAQVISVLMILGGIALLLMNRYVFRRKKYYEFLEENKA